MQTGDGLFIMRDFPDFTIPGFDMQQYNERFKQSNVIIHAAASDVAYPEHWGCLSVKCAFNGNEYYRSNGRFYAVNNSNYLILNEGQTYSSYIYSEKPVESFTINFSSFFEETVIHGLLANMNKELDTADMSLSRTVFVERLYQHGDDVSPVLKRLYYESLHAKPDTSKITELYYLLLERLLYQQEHINAEIQKVKASKPSTQVEIYRRLHYAKDYVDSCFNSTITLQQLSAIACLNSAYFLRQFKSYFGVTPYQYIIKKRMEAAKAMLESTNETITEVCFNVGYEDATSFTRLFKQHFGLSPEKYRLECTKKSIFTC